MDSQISLVLFKSTLSHTPFTSLAKLENLSDSSVYDKFAYHIALLKQFDGDVGHAQGLQPSSNVRRAASLVQAPMSVHGSSFFASTRKDKRSAALPRAMSSGGLERLMKTESSKSL